MQEIYRKASRVTVCLGDAPDAELARELRDELGLMIFYLNPSTRSKLILERYMSEKAKNGGKAKRWLALLNLLQNPWFERCWIVQEVTVASMIYVIYGGRYIPWEVIIALSVASRELDQSLLLSLLVNSDRGNTWA